MANTKFDAKSFNPEAFKYAVNRVPNLKTNELMKSRALVGNSDIREVFSSQNGTAYARIAMKGLLDGTPLNYDGQTNITATSTKTYEQGVVVVGRAKAWTEKDFSYDITAGVDFMENIAAQVAEYWQEVDQDTLLAVLKGIFNMTGTQNLKFVDGHTTDVSGVGDGAMSATSLNSATNKACGANKKKFTMVFMHSDVATGLENLNCLQFLKYTDANGVTRDLGMATWNGKMVIIDDYLPILEGYYAATSTTTGALLVVADSATPAANEIKLGTVTGSDFSPAGVAVGDYVLAGIKYVSYGLGEGAFAYENIGAKVPYEMDRNPAANGGEDVLYTRQRKVFAPAGISYEKASQASLSPVDAELQNGANWAVVHTGEAVAANRTYYNHKAIPICRILSKG